MNMDMRLRVCVLLLVYAYLLRDMIITSSLIWYYLYYHERQNRRRSCSRRLSNRRWSLISKMPDQFKHLREMVELNDQTCINNLRMDRNAFCRLCYLLDNIGGLHNDKFVSIPEKVAVFLLILSHHTKNVIIKHNFKRSGHTISKYFHQTLRALIKISALLLVDPIPIGDDCTTDPWKFFKGCIGALDGTYIQVRVPRSEQPRYRSRKGLISVNVLGVCDRNLNFIYVLAGWEGSAADSRVLRDAINRPNGLRVPSGSYYLCDCGYMNCEGFLTPYRGTRYHLQDWENGPSAPQNAKEYFNLKHSKARNVIERAFGLLKRRWAILRSPSFYPIKDQNLTILACALLHNFIRTSMSRDPFEEINDEDSDGDNDAPIDMVESMHSTSMWNERRDQLAAEMYQSWRGIQCSRGL